MNIKILYGVFGGGHGSTVHHGVDGNEVKVAEEEKVYAPP